MAEILSIPFRFGPDGRAATVEQDSTDGVAEQIAVLILTHAGERVLVPSFGIADPTWAGLDLVEINAGLQRFGPPARVTQVRSEFVDSHTERVLLEFE